MSFIQKNNSYIVKSRIKTLVLLLLAIVVVSCNSKVKKAEDTHDGHDHSKEQEVHSEASHSKENKHDDHDHAKEGNASKGDHSGHNHKEGDHSNEDHSKHDAANGHSKDEHTTSEKEDTHAETDIHLSKAQLKSAKVKIEALEKRNMRERVEVTGSIEVPPQSRASVYAPMEAFVYSTKLLPGDKVRKGQTVAVLQHPSFIELQYSYLESINKLNVAQSDYERKKKLYESEIASKKAFLTTESAYFSAKSLVDSYASQLEMMGFSPSKVASEGIQKYVYVGAPISGYVVTNNLSKGKFLSANQEMIEIIDNEHLHAELNVFGTDITKLKKGDDFLFRASGVDKQYDGKVKLISQKVNAQSKTVNVHGHFEDKEGVLKAGMFINAEVLLGGKKVYAVPEEAIIENEDKSYIFMAKSDTEFVPLEVTLGDNDGGFVELKTIQDNYYNIKIVTRGTHFLKGAFLAQSGGMDHGHAH